MYRRTCEDCDVASTVRRDSPYHSCPSTVYTTLFSMQHRLHTEIRWSGNMDKPVRKRRRPAVAWTECRRRTVTCDRSLPCTSCVLGTLTCAYNFPDVPLQVPGSLTSFASNTHADWHLLSSFPTSNSDYQRLYGNGIESSEALTLSSYTRNDHVPDNFPNSGYQDNTISLLGEGPDLVAPRSIDEIPPFSSSLNIQDVPNSTKSSLSRGTHLTPNHWKNVFRDVCDLYNFLASLTKLTLWSPFDRMEGR
jgi:hypothetical protein